MSKPTISQRLTDWYLAAMATVFLLYPGLSGYVSITRAKQHLYYLLSGGYLLLCLVVILALGGLGRFRPASPKQLWAKLGFSQKLILGYWLWTVLATFFSVDVPTSFWGGSRSEGLVVLTLYCLCFLLVSLYGRPALWQLWLFAGAVGLNCVLCLVQMAGYNPFGLYPAGMTYQDANVKYVGEYLGTIGNVDMLAAVLCVAIPLCWVGLLRLGGRRRFFLLIPLGLSLAVLALSRVEAGLVGVGLGALLTLPVVLPKRGRLRPYAALGAAGALILGVALVYTLGGRMGGALYEAHQLLHGHWDDSYGSGRLYIWRSVLDLVPQSPLFGGGPDTLALRTQAVFERYDETLGVLLRGHVDAAHNEYLNILVNQGLPALLFYLGALLAGAVGWVKRAPNDPASAILGAAVLCYCIQAFFGISSLISAPFFWLTFALLAGRKPCPSK
jgi:O-antigen ligase